MYKVDIPGCVRKINENINKIELFDDLPRAIFHYHRIYFTTDSETMTTSLTFWGRFPASRRGGGDDDRETSHAGWEDGNGNSDGTSS